MVLTNKFCTCCKKNLSVKDYIKRGSKDVQKYDKCCRKCVHADWQKKMWHRSTKNKKTISLSANRITIKYLNYLYKKQKGKCYWLGIEMDIINLGNLRYISIDRIDNKKGYIKGNVVLTTKFANLGRHVASKVEMLKFVNEYLKKK